MSYFPFSGAILMSGQQAVTVGVKICMKEKNNTFDSGERNRLSPILLGLQIITLSPYLCHVFLFIILLGIVFGLQAYIFDNRQ